MMRINALLFLFFLCLLFGVHLVDAQISAEGSVWTGSTQYASSAQNDTVFCFLPGSDISLSYVEADGASDYRISWYQYQAVDNSWNTPYSSGGVPPYRISGLMPGGYRIEVLNASGEFVKEQRCWVFQPALSTPTMEMTYDDCFSVEFESSCDSVALPYYDPTDGARSYLPYRRVYTWTTLPEQSEAKNGSKVSLPAPYDNVSFLLAVSDRFGNVVNASSDYQAIAVKADFEYQVMKPDVINERHTEVAGSAPVEIRFTDASRGAVSAWEWTFGEVGRAAEPDPFFVFTEEGRHTVGLRVVNRNSGCEDSTGDITDEEPLEVVIFASELEVPNVFSPNDDGVNDEFRVAYRSLKKFEMVVFNRWGRKVFQSSDPSVGWDGTIGGQLAAPGVYFYYVTAQGYNAGEEYKLKGPIHLIRGRN